MTRRILLLLLLALPCFAAEQVVVARSRMLVLWRSGAWLFAATSDLNGNNKSPVGLVATSPTAFSAATDGEQFLIAWESDQQISVRLNTTLPLGEGTSPVAAWDGTHYLVFFVSAEGTKVAVITPQGVLESTHTIAGIGTVTRSRSGRGR